MTDSVEHIQNPYKQQGTGDVVYTLKDQPKYLGPRILSIKMRWIGNFVRKLFRKDNTRRMLWLYNVTQGWMDGSFFTFDIYELLFPMGHINLMATVETIMLVVYPWWRHQMETFPRCWPFVRGIRRSPVNSPHKGQWHRALMFPLIFAWANGRANHRDAGNLRRHCTRYDVTVMTTHVKVRCWWTSYKCMIVIWTTW